jgi:hypothetical protein
MKNKQPASSKANKAEEPEFASQSHQGVVSQVVAKIRGEPFLFVIAISALLVGFTVTGAKVGPENLRLTVLIISSLAFAVIIGYYVVAVRPKSKDTNVSGSDASTAQDFIRGSVTVKDLSDEAELKGVKATGAMSNMGTVIGDVDVGKASGKAKATGVELGGNDRPTPST